MEYNKFYKLQDQNIIINCKIQTKLKKAKKLYVGHSIFCIKKKELRIIFLKQWKLE